MEEFFYIGSVIKSEEVRELLLRRYHSIDFLDEMSLDEFVDFYIYAKRKERDELIYAQWIARLPQFSEQKFMNYAFFKNLITGEGIDKRSAEEILEEAEEIEKGFIG